MMQIWWHILFISSQNTTINLIWVLCLLLNMQDIHQLKLWNWNILHYYNICKGCTMCIRHRIVHSSFFYSRCINLPILTKHHLTTMRLRFFSISTVKEKKQRCKLWLYWVFLTCNLRNIFQTCSVINYVTNFIMILITWIRAALGLFWSVRCVSIEACWPLPCVVKSIRAMRL